MAAPTNAAYVKKALANSEPSTHGPFATLHGVAAFESLSKQSGHQRAIAEAVSRAWGRGRICSVSSFFCPGLRQNPGLVQKLRKADLPARANGLPAPSTIDKGIIPYWWQKSVKEAGRLSRFRDGGGANTIP